jgi:hypothetical protein
MQTHQKQQTEALKYLELKHQKVKASMGPEETQEVMAFKEEVKYLKQIKLK